MSLLVESGSGQQTLMQLPLACLLHRLDRAAAGTLLLPPDLGEVMLMDTGGRSASRDLDNIRWAHVGTNTI
jgi:hypothetical protein